MIFSNFINSFNHYLIDILPALIIGFLLSGIIHEFISDEWINKHLGGKGIKGILWTTLIGTLVPVCCWGCLPIAVSFRKKGASLGPILAMLVATPATSINALIVTEKFFGPLFTLYLFFSVIIMGIIIGIIGNSLNFASGENETKNCDCNNNSCSHEEAISEKKSFKMRIVSILKYSYIEMPEEIGKETLLGLVLAAVVNSVTPISFFVKNYLAGNIGYLFAVVFGIITYMCATMGVPFVDALVKQGLGIGPGFVLLLIGPITSYGTLLVLKKEFGIKVVAIYLALISSLALILGCIYSLIV